MFKTALNWKVPVSQSKKQQTKNHPHQFNKNYPEKLNEIFGIEMKTGSIKGIAPRAFSF